MSTITIDYCWENDGFINLDSEDLSQDEIKSLRNALERTLIREGAYKNTWGEIIKDEDGWSITCYDRDPEDIIEQ